MAIVRAHQFVFYHNPVLGIRSTGYSSDGNFDRRIAERCFTPIPLSELRSLQSGFTGYVDREIYDDYRVPNLRELLADRNNDTILAGFIRVSVERISSDGIDYASNSGCRGHTAFDGYPGSWYQDPDGAAIERLVDNWGEGLVRPPTLNEALAFTDMRH